MAEDVQGLIVLTEGDRFVTIGRAGRARVWRVDLSGEPVDDVDRTGAAPAMPEPRADGTFRHLIDTETSLGGYHRGLCTCGWRTDWSRDPDRALSELEEHQRTAGA